MCSPRRGRAVRHIMLAGGLAWAVPAVVAAQSTADARAELDRLLPEWREAREAAADGERARRKVAGAMLVERGSLRIMTDSTIAGDVGDAAETVVGSLDRVFGPETSLLSQYPMVALLQNVMQAGQATRVIRVRLRVPEASVTMLAGRMGSQERTVVVRRPEATADDLVRAIEATAVVPLHATLDDELRLWFRSPLPAAPESRDALEGMYIDLTAASTDVSRRCLAGEDLGCRQALGLARVSDPVLEGYTPTQRRIVVQGNVGQLRTPGKTEEFDRCVRDDDDAACIARLRDLSVERLMSTFSPTALRRGFAQWAIGQGGSGAYSRLRASVGQPIAERFSLAAGMPIDALVASWHRHLMTGRPTTPGIPPLTAVTTLLWIGVCGALSLRSSRWR